MRGTFRELANPGEIPEPHTPLIPLPGAMHGGDKGVASFSRTCTAKVRLAKGLYAEGAPGRLGDRWP